MNVSGIRPYAGFYQYNSIKINELRAHQVEVEAPAEEVAAVDPVVEETKRQEEQAAIQAKQTFDSYDFAQQYQPDEEYELKGVDSEISKLDAEKAVSDLDKDQMLMQYQYFVGSQPNAGVTPIPKEDAPLIPRTGENFTL